MSFETSAQRQSVSVVIPARNRARAIGRCLASVLNQTLQPMEIIVVDDGSTDDTVRVVKDIGSPLVRMVSLPVSTGAQAARNAGIRAAVGDWIAFQDSDDEWLPDKLAKQVMALEQSGNDPATVVHTDCWIENVLSGDRTRSVMKTVEGDSPLLRLLSGGGPMFPGIMTSKFALYEIGLLDENVPSYQEWETCIRLARFCRFVHIKEPLFVYNLHDGETISKNIARSVLGYRYVLDKHRQEILDHLGTKGFDAHLRFCARKAMRAGNFALALETLRNCRGSSYRNTVLKILSFCRISRLP